MEWRARNSETVLECIAFTDHFCQGRFAEIRAVFVDGIPLFLNPIFNLKLIEEAFIHEIENETPTR